MFRPKFRSLGYADSTLKYVETARLLYLSSLRSSRRYHRAQMDLICLSVCRMSVVCRLSSACLSSVCRLSVCHETPPSLWDRSLPKFISGFFRPLRGSVKIWYWPQSNPPPPNAPQKWPRKMKFCTYLPDPCRIINLGLNFNYKLRNCACADLSLLVLYVLTWNFVDNLLTLAASEIMAWISTTRCATAHAQIYLLYFCMYLLEIF